MKIQICRKAPFAVIGKEGSTNEGEGFIQSLWDEANAHFQEVEQLAQRDGCGNLLGIWGALSDFSRAFHPWENEFTEGLYLAGVECAAGADAPTGWTKWMVPGFEYLYAEDDGIGTFQNMLQYLQKNEIALAGAVQEFHCPKTKKAYLFFPILKL